MSMSPPGQMTSDASYGEYHMVGPLRRVVGRPWCHTWCSPDTVLLSTKCATLQSTICCAHLVWRRCSSFGVTFHCWQMTRYSGPRPRPLGGGIPTWRSLTCGMRGRDTSEEDDHVLAFFDALIEQEGMMNSHPDDSNSSSSSSPPQGDNRPLDSLSLSSSDRDDNEEESSSDAFPFWPSDWSSPANTSSLEPPWSDSNQSLLELGGSGEETGEDRDEGSLDNDDTSEDVIRSVSIVEGALGDDTAVLALRPSNNVTREGPLEDATGGTELREGNVAGEPRT
eukprot:Em0019g892a